jgi:hypothetical protein
MSGRSPKKKIDYSFRKIKWKDMLMTEGVAGYLIEKSCIGSQ